MAWVDLESDIAKEFSELAETTESLAANHLLASGQLSVLYGGRKWHSGKPTRTLEEKRAANRAWWRKWHAAKTSLRAAGRRAEHDAKSRLALAQIAACLAEEARQLMLPIVAPGDVAPRIAVHPCAAESCGLPFVAPEDHAPHRYCSAECRERAKSRRKRARAAMGVARKAAAVPSPPPSQLELMAS